MKSFIVMLLVTVAFSTAYAGSSQKERERIKKLDAACAQAKEKALKPYREAHIRACIDKDKLEPAYCKRYFETFQLDSLTDIETGETVYFNQLPECEAAFQARKNSGR
jgi:hypothetical protein